MSLRVYLLYSKRFKTRSSKFWKCLDSFYSLLCHIYNLRRLLPIKQTNQTKTIKFQIRQTLLRRSIYLCLYDLIKKLSHHHKRATNYNCKSGSSLEGSSFFVLDLLFWTAFSGWLYEHLSELYAHLVTQKTKSSLKSKTGWLPGLHSLFWVAWSEVRQYLISVIISRTITAKSSPSARTNELLLSEGQRGMLELKETEISAWNSRWARFYLW